MREPVPTQVLRGLGCGPLLRLRTLDHKSMQIYRHTPEFPAQSVVLFALTGGILQCGQFHCGLFLIYSAACSKKEMNVKEIYVKRLIKVSGGGRKLGDVRRKKTGLRENSNAGHLVMEHQRLGPLDRSLEREIRLASVPSALELRGEACPCPESEIIYKGARDSA